LHFLEEEEGRSTSAVKEAKVQPLQKEIRLGPTPTAAKKSSQREEAVCAQRDKKEKEVKPKEAP
jgi:hypothetical protein